MPARKCKNCHSDQHWTSECPQSNHALRTGPAYHATSATAARKNSPAQTAPTTSQQRTWSAQAQSTAGRGEAASPRLSYQPGSTNAQITPYVGRPGTSSPAGVRKTTFAGIVMYALDGRSVPTVAGSIVASRRPRTGTVSTASNAPARITLDTGCGGNRQNEAFDAITACCLVTSRRWVFTRSPQPRLMWPHMLVGMNAGSIPQCACGSRYQERFRTTKRSPQPSTSTTKLAMSYFSLTRRDIDAVQVFRQ